MGIPSPIFELRVYSAHWGIFYINSAQLHKRPYHTNIADQVIAILVVVTAMCAINATKDGTTENVVVDVDVVVAELGQ